MIKDCACEYDQPKLIAMRWEYTEDEQGKLITYGKQELPINYCPICGKEYKNEQ